MSFRSKSLHVESNGRNDVCIGFDGKPLEGTMLRSDMVIRRFREGLLDEDSFLLDGTRIVQSAIEGSGHIEYWREGRLHRDDGLPAVAAAGFTEKGVVGKWCFHKK